MKLGRYVYEAPNGQYYDSLRHVRITAEQLIEYKLLEGQEEEAVVHYLTTKSHTRRISLIPSYECNERCKMCCVGHMLKLPTGSAHGTTDVNKLVAFMRKLGTKPCGIAGGEPFLHKRLMADLKAAMPEIDINVTTNGVWNYEEVKESIAACSSITFSVDGLPEDHNSTRTALKMVRDAYGDNQQFAVTVGNIAKVRTNHPDILVNVQGCMLHKNYDYKYVATYHMIMMMVGVEPENITLANAASSRIWDNNEINREGTKRYTRTRPCCDFSLNMTYCVYDNKIYPSYYNRSEDVPLGDLDTDVDVLIEKQKEYILANMPMLQDPVCTKECKAVGICWGLCTNISQDYKGAGLKLSDVCGRSHKEGLLELMVKDELSK